MNMIAKERLLHERKVVIILIIDNTCRHGGRITRMDSPRNPRLTRMMIARIYSSGNAKYLGRRG